MSDILRKVFRHKTAPLYSQFPLHMAQLEAYMDTVIDCTPWSLFDAVKVILLCPKSMTVDQFENCLKKASAEGGPESSLNGMLEMCRELRRFGIK